MNLYEAIFLRKSVRNYEMEALKPSLLTEIKDYCKQIEGLNPGITTDISIIDNTKGQYKRVHLLGVKAPYYLAFYSEDKEECVKMHRKAYQAFPVSRVYQAHIPTCSSGYWLFGFASKKYHPLDDFRPEEWKKLGIKTRYYTTNLHRGAFMLPGYVEQMLEEEENEKKA